jgi:hypothetical protein
MHTVHPSLVNMQQPFSIAIDMGASKSSQQQKGTFPKNPNPKNRYLAHHPKSKSLDLISSHSRVKVEM